MSEANILNASAADLLNPSYGYQVARQDLRQVFESDSGKNYVRGDSIVRGRVFELGWSRVPLATMHSLLQWEEQYKADFFTFVEWERTRYYTGMFDGPLQVVPESNEAWTIRGRFKELPGLALNTYPVNWTRDAVFIEERDSSGYDLLKQTVGVWTYAADANAHGLSTIGTAAHFTYPNSDATGKAEWSYVGYGCQIYAKKANNLGIFNVRVTRMRDSTVVSGPSAVDQYSAGTVASAALLTIANLPLDRYRVAIEATNTKNGASAAKTITADAIQVMK